MKSELTLPWIGMKPQHILGGIVGLACLAIWCAVSVIVSWIFTGVAFDD